MATAFEVVNRALRLCKVIDADTAASANDAQDALETLNAMLAEWHEAEIGLPDYQLDALTDTLASDAADREAIALQLALRVAPEYGLAVSPEVFALAQQTMQRLQLRYFQPNRVDPALPSTRHDYFDVEAG